MRFTYQVLHLRVQFLVAGIDGSYDRVFLRPRFGSRDHVLLDRVDCSEVHVAVFVAFTIEQDPFFEQVLVETVGLATYRGTVTGIACASLAYLRRVETWELGVNLVNCIDDIAGLMRGLFCFVLFP